MTNCHTLKTLAADGKIRMTDVADSGQIFRLIQSILSPKIRAIQTLAGKNSCQRLDEIQDPELSIARALEQ